MLLAAAVLIALAGVLFIYSATWDKDVSEGSLHPLVVRQGVWVFTGIVLMLAVSWADYLKLINYAYIIYILNLLALLFLLFFGGERYGARRWISLGPVSFQPSEFMKLTVILVLAEFLGSRRERTGSLGNFIGALLLIAPAALLIFLQPDLGTSFVLIPILFSVLYVCGEKMLYLAGSIVAGLAMMPLGWSLLKDYQKSRLMVFLNPDLDPLGAGYTIIQSKIAVGSGGLFGKGWLSGTQSYLKFLPERHTDFIFSVVGEEWGFIGAAALIGIFGFLIFRSLRALVKTEEVEGRAIVAGVITLLTFQLFVNIAMTIGLMPVVGLPLPAISYGGSNTITTLVSIGFILSVVRKNTA